ncbi:MAG: hypothetical protein AB1589_31790 [Cyanobacteriota bacterium]
MTELVPLHWELGSGNSTAPIPEFGEVAFLTLSGSIPLFNLCSELVLVMSTAYGITQALAKD